MGIDEVTRSNAAEFGINLNAEYQRERNRAPKRGEPVPKKTEIFLAADTVTKNFVPNLQEDPRSPLQRREMRKITDIARAILKKEAGIDISNADFQALMWYPEKNLFFSHGVRKGKGDDNDYIDGAIALLRSEGYEPEQIAKTLSAADTAILRDRTGAQIPNEGASASDQESD